MAVWMPKEAGIYSRVVTSLNPYFVIAAHALMHQLLQLQSRPNHVELLLGSLGLMTATSTPMTYYARLRQGRVWKRFCPALKPPIPSTSLVWAMVFSTLALSPPGMRMVLAQLGLFPSQPGASCSSNDMLDVVVLITSALSVLFNFCNRQFKNDCICIFYMSRSCAGPTVPSPVDIRTTGSNSVTWIIQNTPSPGSPPETYRLLCVNPGQPCDPRNAVGLSPSYPRSSAGDGRQDATASGNFIANNLYICYTIATNDFGSRCSDPTSPFQFRP